jgi:transposase
MAGQQKGKGKAKLDLGRQVNPDAAGIDLGSRTHYVALPHDRDEPVTTFGCFTEDLDALCDFLKSHRIRTVAMEATAVYWVPVFQKLERAGFDVQLVNSKHIKMVPGRKTDVQDCQWIQLLHECGLLRGSYRPPDANCVLRTYIRQSETLTDEVSRHVQRMQKALEQMNIQLHKVIDDITGQTGMGIIKAILAGERDPAVLAKHRNYRCRRSEADFVKGLLGDWREEHLFCLEQEVAHYEFIQKQLADCDAKIKQAIENLPTRAQTEDLPPPKNKKMDQPLRVEMFRVLGQDVTGIEGIGFEGLKKLIAEVGTDVSRWPTVKHFTSWAQVCPSNNITGGKRRRSKKNGPNRIGQIFREAAHTLARSKSALGAYYRRIASRRDAAIAKACTAHKLAQRFYYLLKHGRGYVQQSADYYEQRYKARILGNAFKTIKKLAPGSTVILSPDAAPIPGSA